MESVAIYFHSDEQTIELPADFALVNITCTIFNINQWFYRAFYVLGLELSNV